MFSIVIKKNKKIKIKSKIQYKWKVEMGTFCVTHFRYKLYLIFWKFLKHSRLVKIIYIYIFLMHTKGFQNLVYLWSNKYSHKKCKVY